MKKIFTLVVAMALCSALSFAQGLGLKGIGGSVGYTSVSFSSESLGGFVIGAHADLEHHAFAGHRRPPVC